MATSTTTPMTSAMDSTPTIESTPAINSTSAMDLTQPTDCTPAIDYFPAIDSTLISSPISSHSKSRNSIEMETPHKSNIIVSEIVPQCEDILKPLVGRLFESVEDFEELYKKYAHKVGFSVRSWTARKDKDGILIYKYFVCSKEGYKLAKGKNIERKRLNTREGCNATASVKRTHDEKYVVNTFYEGHSHELCTPRKKQFLRSNRKIAAVHKNLLTTLDRVNIGPTKAVQLLKEQVGGFNNLGFTLKDAQNYSRDLKALIKDSDAHIFIENFKIKNERDPSFFFSYELDDDSHLKSVFWADGIARNNYAIYGDLLSFDTTYSTNKYSLIFAPFTGINNHRLSVTFGAAFLSDERTESFLWLFNTFLDCMGGNEPTLIVTDQDPAIRSAISKIFINSRHRFYMWHIMKKLSEKVGSTLNADKTFFDRFKSCVWNSETINEFETTWQSIILDYELLRNDWLSHMFEIRSMWIPAYFIDIPLSALVRTTSRSESENAFFNNFVNNNLGLLEFYSRFDNAMDAQRQKDLKCNHDIINGKPVLKTGLPLEQHACNIYTHKNFYIFQDELWASSIGCGVKSSKEMNDNMTSLSFIIYDSCKPNDCCREVFYNNSNTTCSCKMYETQGIPCRHIILVWKGQAINELPPYCIKMRWTKMASNQPVFSFHENQMLMIAEGERLRSLISKAWTQLSRCVEVSKGNKEALVDLIETASAWEQDIRAKYNDNEILHEPRKTTTIDILPPNFAKTKGSGKRLKGGKEVALQSKQKIPRLCRLCGEHGLHDSRNCPKKTIP